MKSVRTSRVGEEIRSHVAKFLITEAQIPGAELVTVTTVKMTADLSIARIYYTVIGDGAQRKATKQILRELVPTMRTQVAKGLNLRRTPQLQFLYDELGAQADRLESLFSEIQKK